MADVNPPRQPVVKVHIVKSSLALQSTFLKNLTVLFIGLKLTGHVAWAWPWVVLPLVVAVFLNLAKMAGSNE